MIDMKAILLLHAAISHAADARQRPVSRRGRMDAMRLGEITQARELFPERILISPALSARQSIEALCQRSACPPEVLACDELFAADQATLLGLIARLPDSIQRVMIVAHAPGMKPLLHALTGWERSLPASSLAYVVVPICAWGEILELESGGVLVELWRAGQAGSSYFMQV